MFWMDFYCFGISFAVFNVLVCFYCVVHIFIVLAHGRWAAGGPASGRRAAGSASRRAGGWLLGGWVAVRQIPKE